MMREMGICMLTETARSSSKAVAEADRRWAEPLEEKQKGRDVALIRSGKVFEYNLPLSLDLSNLS